MIPGKTLTFSFALGILTFLLALSARKLIRRSEYSVLLATAQIAADILQSRVKKIFLLDGAPYVRGVYKGRKVSFWYLVGRNDRLNISASIIPYQIKKPLKFISAHLPKPTAHTAITCKSISYVFTTSDIDDQRKSFSKEETEGILEELTQAANIVEQGAPYFKE